MYSRDLVFNEVLKILRVSPRSKLSDVATRLRLGRHTILRVLNSRGCDFRSLKNQITETSLRNIHIAGPAMSKKEIAFRLGFPSLSSFSHFARRHKLNLSEEQSALMLSHAKASRRAGLPHSDRRFARSTY